MTREDYELFAEAIGKELAHDPDCRLKMSNICADVFKGNNGLFQRQRFQDRIEGYAKKAHSPYTDIYATP